MDLRILAAPILLLLFWSALASPGPATNDETALLVLANRERAVVPVPPLVWVDGLGAAAREHSDDMAANGCFSHNSCNGETWDHRIDRHYTGWSDLAENISGVPTDPRDMHAGWMSDLIHRENILDGALTEFGAGITIAVDGAYGTEDFGSRGPKSPASLPTLPAGAVLPRVGGGEDRRLMVNVFHYGGGMPQVHALLGSECVALSLAAGTPTHGTYEALHATVAGCAPLVFEAIRSDGVRARFPSSGAILVGDVGCAERTSTLPTADCGLSGPTPTASPTSIVMTGVHLAIRPKAHQVTLQGDLLPISAFDPTGPAEVTLTLADGTRWSQSLPTGCRAGSCIYAASAATYRSRYDTRALTLSFIRSRSGSWSMRFSSGSQTFGPVTAGRVDAVVKIGSLTASASVGGRVRESSLIAP